MSKTLEPPKVAPNSAPDVKKEDAPEVKAAHDMSITELVKAAQVASDRMDKIELEISALNVELTTLASQSEDLADMINAKLKRKSKVTVQVEKPRKERGTGTPKVKTEYKTIQDLKNKAQDQGRKDDDFYAAVIELSGEQYDKDVELDLFIRNVAFWYSTNVKQFDMDKTAEKKSFDSLQFNLLRVFVEQNSSVSGWISTKFALDDNSLIARVSRQLAKKEAKKKK